MVMLGSENSQGAIHHLLLEEETGYLHMGGKHFLCLDAD